MRSRKRGQAAGYCSNGGDDDRILGFFWDEFYEENMHFRGCNYGEWLNLVQLRFLLALTKMYVFFFFWGGG